MKHILKILTPVCFALLVTFPGFSQKVTATAGGIYQAPEYSVEWTLGEIAIQTLETSGFKVTEGFHQPALIITKITETADANPQISVYPNPTYDKITIRMDEESLSDAQARLYDYLGRILSAERLTSNETVFSLAALPVGLYTLKITIREREIQQFKIIKTIK